MRWSPLIPIFVVLLSITFIFDTVIAAPIDISTILENREPIKLTAGLLKKGSAIYRKAALLGNTFTKKGGKIVQIKTPTSPPKGMQADHILEAQTVTKAFHDAGYKTKESVGTKILKGVRNILNHPTNMAFVDTNINQAKGRMHRAALAGKPPEANADVRAYMNNPNNRDGAATTTKNLEAFLEGHGAHKVAVAKTHQTVLDAIKIKRTRGKGKGK